MKFGQREIAFVVMLLVLPLAAWWFVLRPNSQQNTGMLKEISAKQAKLQDLNRATGTIGDLKGEIASLDKAILYFQSKLPSEKEIDKVLKEVWLLAEDNRLATKSIRTLQRPTNDKMFQIDASQCEQPIDMKLEGDFLGFYSFLQALENQPRIMRISKMTLKKDDKSTTGRMRADVSMSIFFERSPAARQGGKG